MRPFRELKSFAEHVSKGNLDVPLRMQKHNYFGAFTESFDRMREELKKSSERENQANRAKKELVAELSHDIKTPVATIQATCEVMEMKYRDEDIREKVSVIRAKASSVVARAITSSPVSWSLGLARAAQPLLAGQVLATVCAVV